eukprot:COSAG02_NODE_330_length_24501_cov_39.465850_30_plen_840_part_00
MGSLGEMTMEQKVARYAELAQKIMDGEATDADTTEAERLGAEMEAAGKDDGAGAVASTSATTAAQSVSKSLPEGASPSAPKPSLPDSDKASTGPASAAQQPEPAPPAALAPAARPDWAVVEPDPEPEPTPEPDSLDTIFAQIYAHTQKQNVRLVELFFLVDADKSGTMNQHEWDEALNLMEVDLSEGDAKAAFEALDVNGQGNVEINDFMARVQAAAVESARRDLGPPAVQSAAAEPTEAGAGENSRRRRPSWVGEPRRVELSLACAGMPSGSRGSLLPMFAVLWMWRKKDRRWQEHGRTEVVRDAEPTFVTSFFLDYIDHNDNYTGDHDQWAKVGIFIRKSTLADLSRHEAFGEAIFTLRDIYRVPVRRIAREMVKGGEIIIRMADATADALPGFVEITCSAAGLPPKSSPFIQVQRYVTGEFEVFHRSEAIYDTDEPHFKKFSVPLNRACLNDMDTFIRFELWDLDHTAGHQLLGSIETSLREQQSFSDASATPVFKLNPPGTKKGAPLAKPMKNTRAGKKRKPRGPELSLHVRLHQAGGEKPSRSKQARKPSVAASMKDDASFLASLLDDTNFAESDMKDVIGDGINYINERAADRQEQRRKNQRSDLPAGMGGFLEEYSLASEESLQRLLDKSGRRGKKKRRGRNTPNSSRGDDDSSSTMNSDEETQGHPPRPESLPSIHERSDASSSIAAGKSHSGLRSKSSMAVYESARAAISAKKNRKSGAGQIGHFGKGRGVGSTKPAQIVRTRDKLPQLAITMRLDAMKIDGGKKPRRRRAKEIPDFEELAGKEQVSAVELATNMSPSPQELAREYRRKKRLNHQPGSVRLPDARRTDVR